MNLIIVLIIFIIFLINIEICYSFRSLKASSSSSSSSIIIIRSVIRKSFKYYSSKNDDYEKMKIDKSKLDDKEKERIAYIEKLSLEADDMVILINIIFITILLI